MIKIRKARLKDIPDMVKLWLELMNYHIKLDPTYYALNKKAIKSYKKWIESNILGKNSIFLVAEDGKELIGHIGGSIEIRPPCMKIEKNGFVQEAVVTKKYRNKGVGKKLTNELLRWFKSKKVSFVELRTHSKNKPTIKAWENMGFKENLKLMIRKI